MGSFPILYGGRGQAPSRQPSRVVTVPVTAQAVSKAIDHGQFTGAGSLKSLADGWWIIPASNLQATGRPSGATGDLVFFIQTLTPSVGNKYGIAMVFGKDSALKDSMWVQYKDTGSWTPWFKEDGQQDLSTINSEIDELKRGNQKVLDELTKIQTAAGNLFAPTQVLFDAEANKLIDAKLNPVSTKADANAKAIADMPANVEKYLVSQGWQKAGGKVAPGGQGGSDHPVVKLPKVWMLFDASIPSSLTGATITTNGEATLRKLGSGNERLWVIVESDVAAKVSGIQVGASLAAKWDTRTLTIDGQQYTGFYSAGGFTTFNKKVTVEFGG